MITVIYGPSGYERHARYRDLVAAFMPSGAVVPEIASCEEEQSLDTLYSTLFFQGLFAGGNRSVFAIRDINVCPDTKELRSYMERIQHDPDRLLCVVEPWPKQTIPAYAKKIFGDVVMDMCFCPAYEISEARARLEQECLGRGGACDARGLDALFEACGHDMMTSINEMEKILLLGEPIVSTVVHAHIRLDQTPPLFAFSSALWAHNPRLSAVLPLWERLAAGSTAPFGVLGYLTKSASDSDAARRLAQADIKIKSGLLEPDQAIVELILMTAPLRLS